MDRVEARPPFHDLRDLLTPEVLRAVRATKDPGPRYMARSRGRAWCRDCALMLETVPTTSAHERRVHRGESA